MKENKKLRLRNSIKNLAGKQSLINTLIVLYVN